MKSNRYPGVNPFETKEQDRFFGRDLAITDLCDLVALEKLVVLFGKSGYGKSSLVNAGLIPKLQNDPEFISFFPIRIRVGSYNGPSSPTPSKSLIAALEGADPEAPQMAFLEKISFEKDLWYHFKKRQSLIEKTYVLIFDQFEEFFGYPLEVQNQFKKELSKLVFQLASQATRNDSEDLDREERRLLLEDLRVHLLFVIREDRLSLLDQLRDRFPTILNKRYQLQALSKDQAYEAIIKPSSLIGENFATPCFDFKPEAIQKILEELSSPEMTKKAGIEAFQLQIVCQHIESNVLHRNTLEHKRNAVPEVTLDDLPDIHNIYEEYYTRQIEQLPENRQYLAQQIIEEGLLIEDSYSGEGRRLSIDHDLLIKDFKLKSGLEDTLNLLENTFLIRRELNSFGSYNYEICHDTLIKPILKLKRERKAREQREAIYAKIRRTRRVASLFVLMTALLVMLISWRSIYFSGLVIFHKQNQPAVANRSKLLKINSVLSQKLLTEVTRLRNSPENKAFINSIWVCGQALTALGELPSEINYDSIFLAFFKYNMEKTRCVWNQSQGTVRPIYDLRVNFWAIGAINRRGLASQFDCNINGLIVSSQLANGAWTSIDIKNTSIDSIKMLDYAAVYPTCQALLSLKYASPTESQKIIYQRVIEKGVAWLKANKKTSFWKDYPLNEVEATSYSKSLTALAIHTLNSLEQSDQSLNRNWLDLLNLAETEFPFDFAERSEVYYREKVLNKNENIFYDATRHLVLPWQIIATVDAYEYGTFSQKIRASRWLSTVVDKFDFEEAEQWQSFTTSEFLIAFRYLAEHKIDL